ncbi:LysM peptidoglycan-binding domain-containing protein [Desulfothermus okinawensis]
MRRFVKYILLAFIFSYTNLFASPPVLFFEKKIHKPNKQYTLYRVKKGEHIYSILRKKKIPLSKFGEYIEKIKKLNPNIKNINHLYAGQIIKLPKTHYFQYNHNINEIKIHPSLRLLSIDELRKKYPFYEKKYIVKKGDSLTKLLKIIGGIPKNLIYNEYLFIFEKLNPHIKNINKLPVGANVTIPTIFRKIKKNIKNKNTIVYNNVTLSILEKLGFKIYKKDIVVLPIKKGWMQIDTSRSPLLEYGDRKKIILLNDPKLYSQYRDIEDPDISICFTTGLSVYDELVQLSKYIDRIKVWPKGENIIITEKLFVAELNGDIQIIKHFNLLKNNDISYYIFFLNKKKCGFVQKIAYSFLSKHNVFVYFWSNRKKDFVLYVKNDTKDIYIPKIKTKDNINLFKLKSSQENIKVNITNGISLFLPLIKVKDRENGFIYLIEDNSPELAAILRARGYRCYVY